jgi:hypothetical protein
MAYGLYLKLDQSRWFRNDFSSSNKLTGTIYTDADRTTAANLTGFTLTVRFYKYDHSGDYFNKTASIVTAASGTWSYAVAVGEIPAPGLYNVKIELTSSGKQESTLNTQELLILNGPAA